MLVCKKCHNKHIFQTNQICVFKEHRDWHLKLCELCKELRGCADCEKCNPAPTPQESIMEVPMVEEMGIISDPPIKVKAVYSYSPYSWKEQEAQLLQGIGLKVKCINATQSAGHLVEGATYNVLVAIEKGMHQGGEVKETCYIVDTRVHRTASSPFNFEFPYLWAASRFTIVSASGDEYTLVNNPSEQDQEMLAFGC